MEIEANLVGQTLGAYRIMEQIGRGGMATVYKAYEPALDRYVAIKILPQYFAHDPDFAARFEREAKAVAKLNHPNILPIYSFGQQAGLSYIVMRYVEAGTLKEMLEQSLDLKTTADILRQIGQALDYAHQRGVVHRDVKPTNVLMAEGKWALLTDFGLARMVESSVQITKSGVGVGTPAYMSPEQGQGIKVDARSDLYSLGVVLYEMVTGKVPYEAETPMAVVLKHITAPLPLPREVSPDIPEAVERVILKAMAKAPEDRYQTAGEMIEALEKAVAGVPVVKVKPVPVKEVPPAVVTEPAPAPAVAVPVEAPPVTKRGLPAWAWGVVGALVMLIAAGGVFLATRGEEPSPTPAATAALAATPVPAMEADPTVYDDFNNPANEGSYNKELWRLQADRDEVAQQDGAMVFTVQGEPHKSADLTAFKYYKVPLDRPTFFEARLMLSPDANDGNVHLYLDTELSPDEVWYTDCIIHDWKGEAWAGCSSEAPHGQDGYDSEGIPVPFGSWHTVRMEVDPAPMTFSYFVDQRFVGSYTPRDADRLKEARFTLSVGIYSHSVDTLTGYVDDVRVGPLEAPTATPIPPSPQEPVSPGSPPAERFFHDDFEGEALDPVRWKLYGNITEDTVFLKDGQFRVEFVNDTMMEQGGNLHARLLAPVKSIEFSIGLEEQGGLTSAFGVDFVSAGERKSLWLNEDGGIAIEEKRGQTVDIVHNMYPPVQYDILLKWEDDKVIIYVDGKPISKMNVQEFTRDVIFWFHMGPGSKVVGYIDDVRLEYVEEGEVFAPLSPKR